MPVCELCGKSDFVKQDGLFVCQGCGTKYTVEEAQKLASAPSVPELAPASVSVGGQAGDVLGTNNAVCQTWQGVIAEYGKFEHPSKPQLDNVVAKAKEALAALAEAAMREPEKYVQNTLMYENCIAIEDSVLGLACYELKEGEWKKMLAPVHRSDLKIPGQGETWKEKRDAHAASIANEYTGVHEDELALKAELQAQAAKIQAQLDELKDEKKSKGFFNFAEKGEVKERMKPVKEQLAQVNDQIRALERKVEGYVEERLAELGKTFIRLSF